MGKRLAFEDILNTDAGWPKPDDQPFVIDDDPWANANLKADSFSRLVFMIQGYKKAADLMVDAAEESPRDRDKLVFPIVFNYRHFVELSLKYQIATFGHTVGIDAIWDTHNLGRLWECFEKVLAEYGTDDPDEIDPEMRRMVAEFAKLDELSFSFRYPRERNGNPVELSRDAIHLPTLKNVMNNFSGYFSGSDGYLSALQSAS